MNSRVNSLLAARLGLTSERPAAQKPVAAPVVKPGNHAPAPHAAEGKNTLDTHHKAHVAAHKKGDFAAAKTHALNYANAASKKPGHADAQPPQPSVGTGGAVPAPGMAPSITPSRGY